MESEEKAITYCPSCRTKYRVPEFLKGRTVSCKKCGEGFKIAFAESTREKPAPGARSEPYELEEISGNDATLLLGRLALKFSFITQEQLDAALAIQKREQDMGRDLGLGELLTRESMISQNHLAFLLSLQNLGAFSSRDRVFGEIVVQNGFAAKKDIDQALEMQKRLFTQTQAVIPIGDVLVRAGILSDEQRDTILSIQNRTRQPSVDQDAFFETAHPDKKPVSGKEAFDVSVSDNQLQAYIVPKTDNLSAITVHDIKMKLEESNVTYGILEDEQIAAFLENGPVVRMPFKVAQAKVPVQNRDVALQLYFPARRLEEVGTAEIGAADSHDRPIIPRVKKGDLIAQRTASPGGNSGVNVFGEPFVLSGQQAIPIPHGQGTETSEDGLRLFADIDGIPDVTIDGRIRVLPELRIQGDVNFKTGPIEFDGYIVVQGEVRNGLSIRGSMFVGREIQKADIDVDGDVVVTGGIIGGRLRASGNVRAKYIKNAVIEALGDVIVQREVYDSRITASGKVKSEQGKVLTSRITSRKGIEAVDIGSVPSKPCDLSVGIDEMTENEVQRIRSLISEKDEWIKGERSLLTRLEQKALILDRKIAATSKSLKDGRAEFELLEEKRAQARQEDPPMHVTRLDKIAAEMETEIAQTEKSLESQSQDHKELAARINERQEELLHSESQLKELEDRYESLIKWSSAQPALAQIIVSGAIFARTSLHGPHASNVLAKNEKKVLIRETNISESVSSEEWSFVVSPLR